MNQDTNTEPVLESNLPFRVALLPLASLVILLTSSIILFGNSATSGPGQIALVLSGALAGLVGIIYGRSWRDLELAVAESVKSAMPAIFILLMVGMLIGVWMMAGTIPYLIFIGLKLLSPEVFYVAALGLSAIIAVTVGSAWTTAGTLGVALMAIASASSLSPSITAGAIISGAYFGDKLSPLSDTTNLASAVTGTELFEHVRFLQWTTIPAFLVAVLVFTGFSLTAGTDFDQSRINEISAALQSEVVLSSVQLLPVLVIVVLAVYRKPAFTSLLLSSLVAAVIGILLQRSVNLMDGSFMMSSVERVWQAAATGFDAGTSNDYLNELLSRGGMGSMMNTVWLILCAMFFGGMMERSGCLAALVRYILVGANSQAALLRRVGLTSVGANLVTSDQYLSIALPSRIFASSIEAHGLKPKNLARALEDYGTVTSPLVPWNTCGAFMGSTLGIATLAYLPYCILNIASPLIALAYTYLNFKIESRDDLDEVQASPPVR